MLGTHPYEDTDNRYGQIEKEALENKWSCKCFRDFLVEEEYHVDIDRSTEILTKSR